MEIVYLLVPLAVLLVGVVIWALLWSIRNGQFDDLEGPAYRILMDDESPLSPPATSADNIDLNQHGPTCIQKK